MLALKRLRIGSKITFGLLIFLLILAMATILLVHRGFKRAEQNAVQHVIGSLQSQSQNALIQTTSLEAQLYDIELQQAASLTEIAAQTMVNAHEAGIIIDLEKSSSHVIWSGSQLTQSPDGLLYYDADPERRTEILHPGNIPPDALTDRNLSDSAILDEIFPALLVESKTAVGIYYQGPQLTFRYYPVRNLPEIEIGNGAAEAAQSMHIEDFPVAPSNNPEQKTIWLPPYVDDAGQGLLVSANAPVYFGKEFQGFIGIDISLARLIDRLNNLKPTPNSFAFLTDTGNNLIAVSPEGANLLAGYNLTAQESAPTGLLGLSLIDLNPELKSLLSNKQVSLSGFTQLHLSGKDMLITYAPLADIGWNLYVAVPLNEVTEESQAVSDAILNDGQSTVNNTLLAMAAFFLLATFVSIFFSYRFINTPLRQLLNGVRTVTSGNLSVSVPVTSKDELGELAESFNQMTEELKQRNRQLSRTSNELEIKKAQIKVAALKERQRLARELHDLVSQALYGIALGTRTAQTQLERDPTKVAEPLDYVLSLAEGGLSEMRALIFELRPESLENEGLVSALSKQSDALHARHKLEITTSFCSEPDISLDEKEMLYRIAQESLQNIAKHASATKVELSLQESDGQLILEIRDNGKGFNPQ